MASVGSGEANPNWRGGRVLASNGYMLVRVGLDHHLADVRGYAYEHRVVAEETLGRRLQPGEVVHHIDHDKTNNAPNNLQVCTGAEHRAEHRSPGSALRLPGEPNHVIECACGCGEQFDRFDDAGRPRRFVPGHNATGLSAGQRAVLDVLAHGPASSSEIADRLARPRGAITNMVSKFATRGILEQDERGRWRIPNTAGLQQDAGTEPDLLTVAWAAAQWEIGGIRDADLLCAIRLAMKRMETQR